MAATTQTRWLSLLALLVVPVFLPTRLIAQSAPADPLKEARSAEKTRNWLQACKLYDEALRKDRAQPEAREGYQRCLRRYHQVRRLRDPGYRQVVARLSASDAFDLYKQVLDIVTANYVERGQVGVSGLFRQGTRELTAALDEEAFRRLCGIKSDLVDEFRTKLGEFAERKLETPDEAREEVLGVVRTARQAGLISRSPLAAAALALEFACGACNALDEYTLFLTPGHFSDVQATLRGRFVGIGIDLAVVDQKVEVARVYPRSPASEAGLLPHDRILRIDGQPAAGLPPEVAADRLRGDVGTLVELEILSPSAMAARPIKMVRRPIVVPSVEHALLQDAESGLYFGHLRINHFQESTVQEVKEALAILQTNGIKGLVLDLRGNAGGLFDSGVQVARLFLTGGVITYTHSQIKDYNQPFKADGVGAFLLPTVVLVDGETASAAEMLAGALKDNGRAKVIGQPTFGKGTIQQVFPLDKAPLDKTPGGIRLTVARFDSPTKTPYTGRGIVPHEPAEGETALTRAVATLLAATRAMDMGMGMGTFEPR